jgi:hypothetical protein
VKTPSQEDLLGYVLGALDAQEHRDVQQLIDQNPEIEEQLLHLKNAVLPLDCLDSSGQPPGLARRTCEFVAGWDHSPRASELAESKEEKSTYDRQASLAAMIDNAVQADGPQKPIARLRSTVSQRMLHPKSWSVPDVLVGMALIAIMAGLLFPTISYTRHNSRIVGCQNNMSQVGVALMNFSSAHDGQFVPIPRNGRLASVGSFGPILKDAGFVIDDSVFSCAGVAANLPPVHIPSCDQIRNARDDDEINHLRRTQSGHFGYTMGHVIDDQYHAPRNTGRSNVVLVADQPSCLPGRISTNHGGKGQNCLFGDGRVAYVVGSAYGDDAIFENDYGVVGPGSSPFDNVIAASHLSLDHAERLIKLYRSSNE